MVYDAIIIGAGVSGLSCAIKLKELGKSCVVLEKSSLTTAKACGGGITNKALSLLALLDIHTSEFLDRDAKIVTKTKQFFSDGSIKVFDYTRQPTAIKYAIGIKRQNFDAVLLKHAVKAGADIIRDYHIDNISCDSFVHVDDFVGKTLVYATGGVLGNQQNNVNSIKTLGMSINIEAVMNLSDNVFYFYIDDVYCGGYAWVFPNGTNRWNIGVWQKGNFKSLKENFEQFYANTLSNKVTCFISKDSPKSGYICCGDVEGFLKKDNVYYVGECVGFASDQNGEGIYQAILSGIAVATDIYSNQYCRKEFIVL